MAAAERLTSRAVVIGAGWAGLAAAERLAARGYPVTVVERLAYPGGRAFSFPDRATGLVLDNGQHVVLGACQAFLGLLDRLGERQAVRLTPRLTLPVWCQGRWSALTSLPRLGSAHLLPSLIGYRHLSWKERLALGRGLRALAGPEQAALDRQPFADWLATHGQSPQAVERLWEPVTVAILNCTVGQASTASARRALRMALLGGPEAAALGYFGLPLGELARRAVARLRRLGVDIVLGRTVLAVEPAPSRRWLVRLAGGQALDAATVIAAVPFDAVAALVPGPARALPPFSTLARLRFSPIVNLYLVYDRAVMAAPAAAFAQAVTQFVFNRGRLLGLPEWDGRWLAVSLSAADHWRGVPAETLLDRVEGELRQAFPALAQATRLAGRVVWQPHATFRASVGSEALRPSPRTPLPGLFLAGDWTATGWPASLESAVQSGQAAAEAAAQNSQTARRGRAPQWPRREAGTRGFGKPPGLARERQRNKIR